MRKTANIYMKHRQIGEAEATYRLLPSLTLSMSNVTCQFASTGLKEERSSRFKRATDEQINAGVPCIELKNHEGLWVEQDDMWSKYLRRPSEVKDLCFAQFARMFVTWSPNKEADEEDKADDNDVVEAVVTDQKEHILAEQALEEDEESWEDRKFDFVMTYHDNGSQGVPLPDKIELKNDNFGGPQFMRKRTRPAALRFHKVKQHNDPDRYMIKELMLYYPLHEELQADDAEMLYMQKHGDDYKVEIVKRQVMPYLEGVEEARFYVEEAQKKLDLEETGIAMDPQGCLDNEECKDLGEEQHPDYEHCVPTAGEFDQTEDSVPAGSTYRTIEVLGDKDLRQKTQSLDNYQKEVINIGVKYCRDIIKSRKAGNKYPTAPLLMVHGGAGAGKSTVINILAMYTQKILKQEGDNPDQPYVIKTAFTGCAASNIQGQTLNAAFGFSFDNKYRSLSDKMRDKRRTELQNLKLVIIDEVSMVKADMLYMLDLRLQEITQKEIPFGGIGVICFGDLMQLRPIQGKFIFEEPKNTADFSEAHLLDPRWKMFHSVILEKNHRQGADGAYADLLNKIRIGAHTEEDLAPLMERVRPLGHKDLEDIELWISGKRDACAKLNDKFMAKIAGSNVAVLKAIHIQDNKSFKPKLDERDNVVATTGFIDSIPIKIGARVMLIHNVDTLDGMTNGQLGSIVDVVKTTQGKVDKLVMKP